ncbi:MAG: initiation control protein YabA [Desulfitobacteriaceae bacterium]|nr:initiation control protein YabA [Desulfitobacteriaceae bacterium]MDD4345380.1 initiation control protein YabA [Desulfitobacteriaceae bacterium]MDD4400297.1 initiation control protein YabA [Desulfitobacteriaceae bacterium]
MRQLTQAFLEVEEKLISLLEEVRSLMPYVQSLEDENLRLKRESCALPEKETERVIANAARIEGVAHDNLVRLYKDGFHVCHLYFGQPMEAGACLFCAGFLRRE